MVGKKREGRYVGKEEGKRKRNARNKGGENRMK